MITTIYEIILYLSLPISVVITLYWLWISDKKVNIEIQKGLDNIDKHHSQNKLDKMYSELIDLENKSTKFKTQKTINRNFTDPITKDRLQIVQCYCGAMYSEETFDLYGCDCDSKTLNTK